jgi:hypothetical protein
MKRILLATSLLFPLSALAQFSGGGGSGTVTALPPNPGVGTDASANAPSISALTILASFTVTNPGQYRVTNECTSTIYAVLGAAGNQTILALGPAASNGAQGGDTSPEIPWYTGPIAVYGASSCPVAARHN